MDSKEVRLASPIFVALGLLVAVFILLTLLDTCNNSYKPTQIKIDTTYIIRRDTIRIAEVKYTPTPRKIIRDTISKTDTTYIEYNDSVFYNDTTRVKNGKIYLRELVHKNKIQSRELAVDCYNTDTIIKIEKETIIRKTAFVKVIPSVFAWGSVTNNNWGAGIGVHALLADRYLIGAAYDIKNQGIQGNFGVKISIK